MALDSRTHVALFPDPKIVQLTYLYIEHRRLEVRWSALFRIDHMKMDMDAFILITKASDTKALIMYA